MSGYLNNFIIYITILIANEYLALKVDKMESENPDGFKNDIIWQKTAFYIDLTDCLSSIVDSYMLLFLLYLVKKFA